MIAATLIVLVCLLSIPTASAQVPITPRLLTPSSTRNLSVPWFPYSGDPACDKEGDIYFHAARNYTDTELLRLSADGSEGKLFRLPDELPEAKDFLFGDFSVAPDGYVYVLGVIPKTRVYLLFRFDPDGKLGEPITPHIPEGLTIYSIVATGSRTVLLSGFYYSENAPPELKDKSYLALLDVSGAVRHELRVSLPGLDMTKLAAAEIHRPGIALGDDGNFYLAGPKGILVISQAGELVSRIPFDNPYAESTPTRLQVSSGLIVITLARVDEDHSVHFRYLVLLNPSGGVVGYYEPPRYIGGRPVCYSREQGFTFLRAEGSKLQLVTARLQ